MMLATFQLLEETRMIVLTISLPRYEGFCDMSMDNILNLDVEVNQTKNVAPKLCSLAVLPVGLHFRVP